MLHNMRYGTCSKIAHIGQTPNAAWHLQLTDGTPTPHNPGGNRVRHTAIKHHCVDETPQQGLALGTAHGLLLPQRGQRLPERAEGLTQRRGNRLACLGCGWLLETGVVRLRLLEGL